MNQPLKMLAEQGDPEAQNKLGILYVSGKGVRQDYDQAAKWLQKAAMQGHVIAQHNLGVLYTSGTGIPRNYEAAGAWFKKAAEQGYAKSQYRLGMLYAEGKIYKNTLKVPAEPVTESVSPANTLDFITTGPSAVLAEPKSVEVSKPDETSSLDRQEREKAINQLLKYMENPNVIYWMVPVILEMMTKGNFMDYYRDAIDEKASGEAPDDLFFDIQAMRFYYACKIALEKPGDPVANFARLDPLNDPELKKVFMPFFMKTVVAWFDAKRNKSKDCDGKAKAWKRRIAEDWMYFD